MPVVPCCLHDQCGLRRLVTHGAAMRTTEHNYVRGTTCYRKVPHYLIRPKTVGRSRTDSGLSVVRLIGQKACEGLRYRLSGSVQVSAVQLLC